jgi:hypothetical protein
MEVTFPQTEDLRYRHVVPCRVCRYPLEARILDRLYNALECQVQLRLRGLPDTARKYSTVDTRGDHLLIRGATGKVRRCAPAPPPPGA